MKRVRVLFLANVDTDNTNAQSLNVREIVTRLDPDRFESTLFYERQPDARLTNVPGIRLLRMPTRGRTPRIFHEMLCGYDLIAYLDVSPASYMFLHLPRAIRGRTKTVYHEEAPYYQAADSPRLARFLQDGVVPRSDICTAITEFIAQDLVNTIHRTASHTLPVGVNTSLFTPPFERSNAAPVVLFAGTMVERKGPQYVLEAASTGLPCIVFRDYQTPSVVHNVTGFQVSTLTEMMDALGRLISDRNLRDQMGTAARKHVAQFDWDLVAAKWQAASLDIAEGRYPAAAHNPADLE